MADKVNTRELRFERLLAAPVETVWEYLVDPDLRARWFMAGPSDLRVGGHLGMTMDHDNLSDRPVPTPEKYRPYVGHTWSETILRFEPPHVLAFEWENGEAGTVTFTLADEGGKTRLTLVHAGLRGPDDAKSFGSGWQSHLAVLERRIGGEAVPDFWALHAKAEAEIAAALRG